MNKSIKRIFIVLFICAFVINITITSYAKSMGLIKVQNTGAEAVGAALAGGGPFFGLVGAALLAAGLICDVTSDDPTDGAVEYFVKDCIVNDHFAGTALEYIYGNLEIDENGNINYKQVVDNINAYVEAQGIVISSGNAVSFDNGVLRVAPEIIRSIAVDFRNIHYAAPAGEPVEYKGLASSSTTFDLFSGIVFPVGSDGDIKIKEIINSGAPYIIATDSYCGNNNLVIFSNYSRTNNSLYASSENSRNWCFLLGDGLSKGSPYGGEYRYDLSGNFLNDIATDRMLGTLFRRSLSYIYYYGNGFYFDDNILSFWGNLVLPVSNDYPVEGWKNLPVRDVYDGLAEDILNVPVVDFPVGGDGTVAIDDGMVNDLDNAFQNVIGVAGGIGDAAEEEKKQVITDSITNALENVIDNAADRVETNNPSIVTPDLSNLKSDGLSNKFPFCIPFDLIDLVSALDAEPEAPKFTIPIIKNEKYGWDYSIDIDWSDFEVVAKVCRSVEVFCFIGFLILKTRSLIRG